MGATRGRALRSGAASRGGLRHAHGGQAVRRPHSAGGGIFPPPQAEKRVALVIGNSSYEHVPVLANPSNDAGDMASVLKSLGFEVVEGTDLKQNEMRETVRRFGEALQGADVSLFFYAGHGMQVAGTNYLVPTDAKLAREGDLDFDAIRLDLVLAQMERETKTSIVLLDACRDNPMAQTLARSMGTRSANIGRGLARIESGVGTFIAFATQPGNVALGRAGAQLSLHRRAGEASSDRCRRSQRHHDRGAQRGARLHARQAGALGALIADRPVLLQAGDHHAGGSDLHRVAGRERERPADRACFLERGQGHQRPANPQRPISSAIRPALLQGLPA